jgi:hypothetical protein
LVASARADVVTDWNVTTNALVANDVGNNRKLRTFHGACRDVRRDQPAGKLPT